MKGSMIVIMSLYNHGLKLTTLHLAPTIPKQQKRDNRLKI